MYFWIEIGALLHQGANSEPKAVAQRELIANDALVRVARVGAVPFVRREAAHEEHGERNESVRHENVQPDVERERLHEGEQSGGRFARYLDKLVFLNKAWRCKLRLKTLNMMLIPRFMKGFVKSMTLSRA